MPLHLPRPPTPALLQGVVSQITPVNPAIFKGLDRPFPPTLFVHMAERDPSKAETVAAALALLKWVPGRGWRGARAGPVCVGVAGTAAGLPGLSSRAGGGAVQRLAGSSCGSQPAAPSVCMSEPLPAVPSCAWHITVIAGRRAPPQLRSGWAPAPAPQSSCSARRSSRSRCGQAG